MGRLTKTLIPHHTNKYRPHLLRAHGLSFLLVLVLALFFLSQPTPLTGHQVLGYASDVSYQDLLDSTNSQRVEASLEPLELDPQLSEAAQAKAEHMVTNNYWSHVSPTGIEPWSFINDVGYNYARAGENLAYGFSTSSNIVDGWMASQTHRDNILTSDFTEVGFGVVNSSNFVNEGPQTVVVALYAQPTSDLLVSNTAGSGDSRVFAQGFEDAKEVSISNFEAMISGKAGWFLYGISSIVLLLLFMYAFRHIVFIHKLVVSGERYLHAHPLLEASLIYLVAWALLSASFGVVL